MSGDTHWSIICELAKDLKL